MLRAFEIQNWRLSIIKLRDFGGGRKEVKGYFEIRVDGVPEDSLNSGTLVLFEFNVENGVMVVPAILGMDGEADDEMIGLEFQGTGQPFGVNQAGSWTGKKGRVFLPIPEWEEKVQRAADKFIATRHPQVAWGERDCFIAGAKWQKGQGK